MMILNEDYFDEIEITDDVITANEYDDEDDEISIDAINKYNSTYYEQSIQFFLNIKKEQIINKFFDMIARKLYSLFELYNIHYSYLYVIHGIHHDLSDIPTENAIININENYIDITYDYDSDYTISSNYKYTIIIYIDYHKFPNVNKLLKFLNRLLKIAYYKNEQVFSEFVFYDDVWEIGKETPYCSKATFDILDNNIDTYLRESCDDPMLCISQSKYKQSLSNIICFCLGYKTWLIFADLLKNNHSIFNQSYN